jgi:hypothetical protein
MSEQPEPTSVPPAPPQKIETGLTEVDYLRQIAEHLKSIRSMLSFFTAIVVLAIILQACALISPMFVP